jgi:tryptophan synthase alpha chain
VRTHQISVAFARCLAEDRAALIPYITAGHPRADLTQHVLEMLAEEGADVIELGVPFSDPLADGPTIQRSSYDAIQQGVDLAWTLRSLAEFRARRDTPVVVFTYLNPVLHYGIERFLADASTAGADGVLITDLPTGYDAEWERLLEESPLDLVRLVAPTCTTERSQTIASRAQGFLYYVSRTGVTGARQSLAENLAGEVAALRSVSPVPVAVGFGISTAAQARTVAEIAEGVVVGSALVDLLARGGIEAARGLVRELRSATLHLHAAA